MSRAEPAGSDHPRPAGSHTLSARSARWRILALVALLLELAVPCLLPSGVAAEPAWSGLSVQDGLLSPSIHALHALPDGRLLIGTALGLNVWDGQRLFGYSAGHGLAQGRITCAVEHRGEIWAGSWGGGLSVLRQGRWRTWRASETPLPTDWISALASHRDTLWIATYGGGLAALQGDSWTVHNRANSPLPSDYLTSLAIEPDGALWVGTERAGLARLGAEGSWRAFALPLQGQTEVTALLAQDNVLWVGTRRGLALLDMATFQWLDHGAGALAERQIIALTHGPKDEVWIGMTDGLALARHASTERVTPDAPLWHPAVGALAVDAQGDLWVGGSVRGLAKQGALRSPEVERLPVLLVHGWRGPDSDLLRDSEFWHLAGWLEQDGFEPHYVSGISPANTLSRNAERLQQAISDVRQRTGATQVDLIAFSMGGLNSRAYLESTLYRQDVRRAFILGTPHRGEHLWLPLLAWEGLAWADEPSAQELLPLHAQLYNQLYGNIWQVPYVVIAGDARQASLPTLFRELPAGDGLVSTWSALGVEGSSVARHVTPDIHAWGEETILLDLPSLLLPRATYDAFIRPYLLGVADAPGLRSPLDQKTYPPVQLPPRSGFRSAQVRPGERVVLASWPIDAGGRSRFDVRWKGPALEVSLRSPDGLLIDPDLAIEEANYEFLSLAFADYASYVITDTLPGPWQIVVESDAANVAPSDVVAYATLDSPLRLVASAERAWYAPGEEALVTARLEDPGSTARVSAASCTIHAPDGRRETIRLASLPGAAADTLEGSYALPDQAGYYTFECRLLGTRGGARFERSVLLHVGVMAQSARLGQTPRLVLEDPAARLPQTAHAQVGVSVRQSGEFLISLALAGADGEGTARIAHPVSLTVGDEVVKVPVPLQAPAVAGLGRPLTLRGVTLVDVSGAGLLADAWQSGQSEWGAAR